MTIFYYDIRNATHIDTPQQADTSPRDIFNQQINIALRSVFTAHRRAKQ